MLSAIETCLVPRALRGAARQVAAALCCMLLANVLVFAQGVRGTINGEVSDPTGAIVKGASVRLVNVATDQEVRTAVTNDEGIYQLIEVEPAVYNVIVSSSGFGDATLTNVKVEPNRNLRLDVALNVTGSSEQVEVTASQELIDRESAALGTTVDRRRVQGLPLNGRNVLLLARLQPGVQGAVIEEGETFTGSGFRVNGQRSVENNVTLDGSNNNEVAVGGTLGAQPRPDAVEEFRLLTSNYEAEFGRNTGAVVNVVTRTGTNEYHGNVRIFYRPTFLSAARFFDKANATQAQIDSGEDLRRKFERKEFGGNIGGPVRIPGLYNGTERTFFFVDYEGRRQLTTDSETETGLPTLAERMGDFSDAAVAIVDPATGQPFPNGIIPSSRFSPIAQYYLQFLPLPTGVGGAVTSRGNDTDNRDQVTVRGDHRLSDAQTVNITYNYFAGDTTNAFSFGGPLVLGFGESNSVKTQNVIARHIYTFSPTVVNSFLASYARNDFPSVFPDNLTSPAEIGFTADFVANPQYAGPPRISLFDRGINIGNSIQGPQARLTENFQIQDSLSWATGDHRFKFGFDGTLYRQQQLFLFNNQGILTYSGRFGGNTTRNDFADFLIGTSPIAVQFGANGDRDTRQKAVAFFAQDTWRVRDDLTLSLGVRYEYNSPLTDKYNRVAYFRAGAVSQRLLSGDIVDFDTGQVVTIAPGGRAPVGLVYPGDPDPVLGGTVPDGGVKKDFNNWAPRVGIAYSPSFEDGWRRTLLGDRATVIRAGIGMFYGAIIGDTQLQQLSAPGFNGTNAFFFPGSGTTADPFAPDPFPDYRGDQGQIPNPFTRGATLTAPLDQFSRPIDPFLRTPYTFQWNLTVERGFGQDYVATMSYVGSRGNKLYVLEEINPGLGAFIPAPPGRDIPPPTSNNIDDRRLNDDIHVGLSQTTTKGNSFYHALQTQLQKRYSNGLLFQTAYTWSKSIDDASDFRGSIDILDRRFDRALSDFDVPHRFVASFLYDLPFANNLDGVAGRVLDGWGVGGIYTAEAGKPFTIFNENDTDFTGGITTFADLGAPLTILDPRTNNGRLFNPDAFVNFSCEDPDTGEVFCFRRGTSGRNQFRANDGANNFDFIVTKKTELWSEESELELRFEFFNLFNHAQFSLFDGNLNNIFFDENGNPDPNDPRTTFGKFTATRESRVVQLAARISF
jgi:outer membrane receptor protein involved in Fe transport